MHSHVREGPVRPAKMRMRQDPRAPHLRAGKSTSQRRRLATQSTNLHSPCFSPASAVSFSCLCRLGFRRAGGCGGISGSAFAPVVSPARQFLSALRRPGHLLSCRAWRCTVSCASHCFCSAVLLVWATSHSMGAHPLSASPRALGPPSTGVGGPCLLLGLLACWALALLSALAARSVWSAALGPPSSGVGGPCSQLGLLACRALALLSALAARSVWSAALGPPSSGVGGPCSQLGLLACWALALLPALAARGVECGAVQHCIQHSGGRRAGPSGQARSSYSSVQAQVAKQGAPAAACRPKWPSKELLQQRAGPSGQARSSYSGVLAQVAYSKARLLQRRAGPSAWPSVAVPRAACWPKSPGEAVFLQRRAGPSGLAVECWPKRSVGLCWIRPSCASCALPHGRAVEAVRQDT